MTILKPLKLIIFSLLLTLSANVWAMSLSDAMSQLSSVKSQGLVGEQPNGYLGVIKDKNGAKEIVELINQARNAQYQKMTQTHNLSLQEIEVLAGKKAITKTAHGNYIKIDSKWIKKP
jgi:uncharacterized protein YdbL (DUF1318 family)